MGFYRDMATCKVTFYLGSSSLGICSQAMLNFAFILFHFTGEDSLGRSGKSLQHISKWWWPSADPSHVSQCLCLNVSLQNIVLSCFLRCICDLKLAMFCSQGSGWYAGKQVRPTEKCMAWIPGSHSSCPGGVCILVGCTSHHLHWAGMAG